MSESRADSHVHPAQAGNQTRPIVLCPLRFELAALRRRGLSETCELDCCGPGERGILQWSERAQVEAGQRVILAGLAGALSSRCVVRSAYVASRVVLPEGEAAVARVSSDVEQGITIASSATVLTSRAAREHFAQATGADLVDQEAAPFARLAENRGWQWGIVRGVSDGLDAALPPDIGSWVNERGGTRLLRVAGSMLRHPGSWRSVVRLGGDSRAAMEAVAERLQSLLGMRSGRETIGSGRGTS